MGTDVPGHSQYSSSEAVGAIARAWYKCSSAPFSNAVTRITSFVTRSGTPVFGTPSRTRVGSASAIALGDLQRVLGDDHPDTLVTRGNLAAAYRNAASDDAGTQR